jgi:hypothetical protein
LTPASGTSAATLHGIGDHYAGRFESTTPGRRKSQRPELRYRIGELDPVDTTIKQRLDRGKRGLFVHRLHCCDKDLIIARPRNPVVIVQGESHEPA